MSPLHAVSRRKFLQSVALASGARVIPGFGRSTLAFSSRPNTSDQTQSNPLDEFSYGDVTLDRPVHDQQLQQTHAVLMDLNEDSLLKPFRQMVGQPAPGEDLGGWYQYDPHN